MGDDAEYYIEQQEEEKAFQEQIRRSRDDQMTKDRIKREKAAESASKTSRNKG